MTLILSWTTPFVNGESGASLFPRVDYRFDMFRGGAPYFLLCAKPIAILSYNKFLPRPQFIYPLITTNTLVHNYRLSLETVSLQFRWCVQSKLTVINYYSCYAPKRRDVCISAIKAAYLSFNKADRFLSLKRPYFCYFARGFSLRTGAIHSMHCVDKTYKLTKRIAIVFGFHLIACQTSLRIVQADVVFTQS